MLAVNTAQNVVGSNIVHENVSAERLLTSEPKSVNCDFDMATLPNPVEDALQDFQFPQREAAFFYGLFLRGHTADELRRDIAVPAAVLAKWDRETVREPRLRPLLERVVQYRRHVLAIFENLIGRDSATQRLQ
ncbi:MAG TPA: hypothetical protein VGR97_07300 [Candidatus Acidoferrales bacterium]|nr:hypothetical protein [Candidatus Acidoferrales bacterium]